MPDSRNDVEARPKVLVGQIWASTDSRDVEAGHNQHRRVAAVYDTHARFAGKPRRAVRMSAGRIEGHRLVRDVG